MRESFPSRPWLLSGIAVSVLLVGLAATIVRIVRHYAVPGTVEASTEGMTDYHNGLYFPTQAWMAGDSPYSLEYPRSYPVARPIPFFSPVIFAIHVPLVLVPLEASEWLFFGICVAIMFGIAALSLRWAGLVPTFTGLVSVVALMVFSRAGQATLFNGYFTLQLVLASLLAIHWGKSRTWASAIALMVVSTKPTYVIPLGFLMLARGNVRAVVMGGAFSLAAAIATLGYLAFHQGEGDVVSGFAVIGQQIADAQTFHRADAYERPVNTWTRVDAFAVASKWMRWNPSDLPHLYVMLFALLLPCTVLRYRHRTGVDDGVVGITGAIVVSASLVTIYHQSYDLLLAVPLLVGLIAGRGVIWQRLTWRYRAALAALLFIPSFNYLSSRMVLSRLTLPGWGVDTITSLSGVSLVMFFLIVCVLGWRTADGKNHWPGEAGVNRD